MKTQPTLSPLYIAGAAICVLLGIIAYLSSAFEYGTEMLDRPIIPFVILLTLAGILYLFAVSHVRAAFPSERLFLNIFLIGLLMRAVMFFSNPILEDDFYRYLWDGAVTANAHNPYRFTPEDAILRNAPQALSQLATESGNISVRVNHPELGTVYPPIAQAAFALAHLVSPWSLIAWKSVLILCDGFTAFLLLIILRKVGLPESRILIYWWNPLLIKETYNSAHMDIVIMVFLALALYAITRQFTLRAALALCCAIATKLWPLILVPLFIRYSHASRPEKQNVLFISAAILMLLCLPMLWAIPLGDKSGFFAYSERWEMNDALFMIVHKAVQLAATPLNFAEDHFATLARITVAAILLLWIYFLARNRTPDAPDFFNRLTLVTGALFMLSPTQFPWYFIWMLPLLTLSPRPSFLLLTALLPLYYLKFYFVATHNPNTFHHIIVWIEFLPVILLFIHEAITTKLDLRPPQNIQQSR